MKSKLIFFGGLISLILLFRFSVNNPKLYNQTDPQPTPLPFKNLSVEESLDLLKQTNDIFLLDVHTPQQEHLDGTDAFIPFDQIVDSQNQLPNDKSTPILVYCRSGSMSLMASEDLFSLGYTNVYNLSGGIHAWEGAGFPINWNQVTK